jgi:hypothetical protein
MDGQLLQKKDCSKEVQAAFPEATALAKVSPRLLVKLVYRVSHEAFREAPGPRYADQPGALDAWVHVVPGW